MRARPVIPETVVRKDGPKQSTRNDGWVNVLTGLGIEGNDKKASATVNINVLSQAELDALYRGDDIAKRIVNRPVRDMFREGWFWLGLENKMSDALEAYFNRLQLTQKCAKASKLARHYGGALIALGIADGRTMDQPVNWTAIRTVQFATVLDRYHLEAETICADIADPNFGLPLTYRIFSNGYRTNTDQIIHADRVIRFSGTELPDSQFVANGYWGDSKLQECFNALQNFNTCHDSSASVVTNFANSVLTMQGLNELLATDGGSLVMQRLRLMNITKSVCNMTILDEGEKLESQSPSINGLADLIQLSADRLVSASDLPHNIILGEGSEGNTSGRAEEKDYYNFVRQMQVDTLRPALLQLANIIQRASDGPSFGSLLTGLDVDFHPLFQLDEVETANAYKLYSEADANYITNGVVDPEEVAESRFSGAEFGRQIKLNETVRAAPSVQTVEKINDPARLAAGNNEVSPS